MTKIRNDTVEYFLMHDAHPMQYAGIPFRSHSIVISYGLNEKLICL